jgi:hypothetical protein
MPRIHKPTRSVSFHSTADCDFHVAHFSPRKACTSLDGCALPGLHSQPLIRPEICHQLPDGAEPIGRLDTLKMPMISLPAFIVVTDLPNARPTVEQ